MGTVTIESGEVLSNGVYSLADFQKRVGLSRDGMRSARRAGLRVIRLHNRAYVRGSDWMDYLNKSVDTAGTDTEL